MSQKELRRVQFPNLEDEWVEIDMTMFFPQTEFDDCVFGKYLGFYIKIYR